jgi:hypothetical protein
MSLTGGEVERFAIYLDYEEIHKSFSERNYKFSDSTLNPKSHRK